MKNILDYSTFDQTEQAIEIWENTDPVDKAQYKLAQSREYAVYKQALHNRANITANMNQIKSMDIDKMLFTDNNHIPSNVGNV
jgi:hypothetical protein